MVQSDGKIVVVGYSSEFSDTGYFSVIRYNTNGTIDLTFGENGIVKTIIGPNEALATAAALQPDGKIIAAGYSWNGASYDFAMVRYTSEGFRDLTFGISGIVTSDFDGNSEKANAIIVRPNGKIVLAGYSDDAANFDINFAIAQYNADGSIDTGFGNNGVSVISVGQLGLWQSVRAIAEQGDGKIVAAGFSEVFDEITQKSFNQIALIRFGTGGLQDPTFGEEGIVTTRIGEDDVATSIGIQADNKIVVLGRTRTKKYSYPDFILARYSSEGDLDNTFGNGGIVITSFDNTDDEGYAMILQADQKILAAGFSAINNGTTVDFSLARYLQNGSLDNTFGIGGKVLTDVGGNLDYASFVLLQKNGKVVVGGYSKIGNDYDISLVRYLNDATLPVKLQSFDLHKIDAGIMLKWKTSFEQNSHHFDIQKSMDARAWATIGTLPAGSTSDSTLSYEFIDADACSGRTYYRLKMVDSDSTFAYSVIRSILVNDFTDKIAVYPNPAVNEVIVKSDSNKPESFIFIDSAGKEFRLIKSSSNVIDISSLKSGLYTILLNKGEKAATKLLISR
ncbi:T9SS type A sorting domain-containing protein [Dyadobacter aurulentus]|uniref:T9SS type A sorting domain-containing protein n=1 Tax=Dyadobacter sp. UC 10 TaxID=2605428 RepID=UPI001E5D21A2|nr:T9SS type A sorting domain-containing protein [Dyadobacter sp. UC 10]